MNMLIILMMIILMMKSEHQIVPRLRRDKLSSLVEHSLEILDNKSLKSTHQKYEDEGDNGNDLNTDLNTA